MEFGQANFPEKAVRRASAQGTRHTTLKLPGWAPLFSQTRSSIKDVRGCDAPSSDIEASTGVARGMSLAKKEPWLLRTTRAPIGQHLLWIGGARRSALRVLPISQGGRAHAPKIRDHGKEPWTFWQARAGDRTANGAVEGIVNRKLILRWRILNFRASCLHVVSSRSHLDRCIQRIVSVRRCGVHRA